MQKCLIQNLAHENVQFWIRNVLKLAYKHLKFIKVFRVYTPDPLKERGRTVKKRENADGKAHRRYVGQREEGKEEHMGRA